MMSSASSEPPSPAPLYRALVVWPVTGSTSRISRTVRSHVTGMAPRLDISIWAVDVSPIITAGSDTVSQDTDVSAFLVVHSKGRATGPVSAKIVMLPFRSLSSLGAKVIVKLHVIPADNRPGKSYFTVTMSSKCSSTTMRLKRLMVQDTFVSSTSFTYVWSSSKSLKLMILGRLKKVLSPVYFLPQTT